jgi:hypothetical protein
MIILFSVSSVEQHRSQSNPAFQVQPPIEAPDQADVPQRENAISDRHSGSSAHQRQRSIKPAASEWSRAGCYRSTGRSVAPRVVGWRGKLFPRIRNWRVASRVGLRPRVLRCWRAGAPIRAGRMRQTMRVIAANTYSAIAVILPVLSVGTCPVRILYCTLLYQEGLIACSPRI